MVKYAAASGRRRFRGGLRRIWLHSSAESDRLQRLSVAVGGRMVSELLMPPSYVEHLREFMKRFQIRSVQIRIMFNPPPLSMDIHPRSQSPPTTYCVDIYNFREPSHWSRATSRRNIYKVSRHLSFIALKQVPRRVQDSGKDF